MHKGWKKKIRRMGREGREGGWEQREKDNEGNGREENEWGGKVRKWVEEGREGERRRMKDNEGI